MIDSIGIAVDPGAPGANIPGVPTRHRVAVKLLAVSEAEEAKSILTAQISNCLAGFEEISNTTVEFIDAPVWTPSRISRAGRQRMQLDFPILNNRVR